jgi:hypothetical protein
MNMSQIYDRVHHALKTLTGNQGEGWIAIIEEPETECFVQFAFDQGASLVFDCPTIAFSDDQLSRAKTLLARYQIEETRPLNDDFTTFNADLGNNIDLAAKIAAAVFAEVFQFSDNTGLNVTVTR